MIALEETIHCFSVQMRHIKEILLQISVTVKKITSSGDNYNRFKNAFVFSESKGGLDEDDDLRLLDVEIVKDLYEKYNKSLFNKMIWMLLKDGDLLNTTQAKLALRTTLKLTHLNQKNQKIVNKSIN